MFDSLPPLFKANESRTNKTGAPSLLSFRILILDPSLDPDHQVPISLFFSLSSAPPPDKGGGMSKLKIARHCFLASKVNKRMYIQIDWWSFIEYILPGR